MTTWYTAQGPGGPMWSYSVRPDLWPAGTCAWVRDRGHGWLADWTARRQEDAVDEANGVPGAAEALILAGQANIMVSRFNDHRVWVETADPRTKGPAAP